MDSMKLNINRLPVSSISGEIGIDLMLLVIIAFPVSGIR